MRVYVVRGWGAEPEGAGAWPLRSSPSVTGVLSVMAPVINSCESCRFKSRTGREALRYFSIRQAHAANQLLKTGIGVKLIEHRVNFQVDHVLVTFLVGLL